MFKNLNTEVDLNADRERFWLGTLSAIDHESNDSANFSKLFLNLKVATSS